MAEPQVLLNVMKPLMYKVTWGTYVMLMNDATSL